MPVSRCPREDELDVHTAEPPVKNEFLEDLDRMDSGANEGEEVNTSYSQSCGLNANLLVLACVYVSLSLSLSLSLQAQLPASHQYDLNLSAEVWSDFLRLHLHPKSLLMLPGHFHNE